MQIEALHHVSIPVSDLERAKRFYEETLGLRADLGPGQRDFGGVDAAHGRGVYVPTPRRVTLPLTGGA